MRILLTGASGFLGRAIQEELAATHEIVTLGRTATHAIQVDLAKEVPQIPPVDLVIHAAGKAHVIPKTPEEKAAFFQVNEVGTKHLLEGLGSQVVPIIFISTVAVYGVEQGTQISENSPLLGDTPYALSKINAEKLVKAWAEENQSNCLIIRPPLIVGSNPPGNLGAIIKAIRSGYYFRMGDGSARKSMVLAQDIAKGIPAWIRHSGTYNLTDGVHPSLAELDGYIASKFGKKVRKMPMGLLAMVAKFGDLIPGFPLNSYRLAKLSSELTFSDAKAQRELNWRPNSVVGTFEP